MRTIHPLIESFIDEKIGPIDPKFDTPQILLCRVANACRAIRSEPGNHYRKLIPLFSKSVLYNEKPKWWCMVFVQTCIAYVEKKLRAPSDIFATARVTDVWRNSPAHLRFHGATSDGALVIWKHYKLDAGHVGILTASQWGSFTSIEANVKSGHFFEGKELGPVGVWPHRRTHDGADNMDLLGLLHVWKAR